MLRYISLIISIIAFLIACASFIIVNESPLHLYLFIGFISSFIAGMLALQLIWRIRDKSEKRLTAQMQEIGKDYV